MIALALLLAASVACARQGGAALDVVESSYEEVRFLKDQIKATRARGADRSLQGAALSDLVQRYTATRAALAGSMAALEPAGLGAEDRRALEVMKRALAGDLDEEAPVAADGGQDAALPAGSPPDNRTGSPGAPVECRYDTAKIAAGGFQPLSDRMYACFGASARALVFEGRTLDRLTVFSLLSVTEDRARRRGAFLALEPVWRSVNGDGSPGSPYRTLIRLSAARLQEKGASIEKDAATLGVDPAKVEAWLVAVLEAWRDAMPEGTIEPWDYDYAAGAMERALAPRLPLAALRPLNDRVYRDLGADPESLGIHYDIEPRGGKDPVAYTDFGMRARRRDGAQARGEYWVSASYAVGGAGNLSELLHETGHGIHIAAIRTRPAFADWPDSDTFTEALAEIVALDLYEPEWQTRYLGAAVPLADAIRAKYAGIVKDTAWALFEIRMHRDPAADPNQVWTGIVQQYLRLAPHPEWSWWAVRGQLIGSPGYMLNYALGAIVIADLRARMRERLGPPPWDATWYPRVAENLYRYGLERTSRQVIEDFLGRPVSPDALIRDLRRGGVRAAGRASASPPAAGRAAARAPYGRPAPPSSSPSSAR